jgi:hypothetical protein
MRMKPLKWLGIIIKFDNTLRSQYNNVDMGVYEDGYFESFVPISLKEAQADISPTGLRTQNHLEGGKHADYRLYSMYRFPLRGCAAGKLPGS